MLWHPRDGTIPKIKQRLKQGNCYFYELFGLESAAGIVGLIKTVLALQHKWLPPSLHFDTPNPEIDFDNSPFYVNTQSVEWQTDGCPRRAGVSSFGIGGTNAHLVLEEAPEPYALVSETTRPLQVLTLSAKTEAALVEQARQYHDHLASPTSAHLTDICYTANTGRAHFQHRAAMVAATVDEARERLQALYSGQEVSGVCRGASPSDQPPKVAFLFTGQGAQYVDMGRQLYETQPTFREVLDRCDALLRPHLERSLRDVLYSERAGHSPSTLDQTAYTQPALFALEYALAALWQSWGVVPDAVMGHSVGEVTAACVAGVLSLEDSLALVAERGRLMQALPQNGAMVVVRADEHHVQTLIRSEAQSVSIAAVNTPENVVISGEREAVQRMVDKLQADGFETQPLTVSHAFHSPLMEPMLADFERSIRHLQFAAPRIPFISNLTGAVAANDIASPAYWVRHVRQPVRFSAGMKTLEQQGFHLFVELGPQPTLLGMGAQCLPEHHGHWLPSLRRGQADWLPLLTSLAALYAQGVNVDWTEFDRDAPRAKVALPTYPFQRQRYWFSPSPRAPQPVVSSASSHPLLGSRLRLADAEKTRFQAQIRPESPAYLADHRVFGRAVLPAAAYVEIALAAGRQVFQQDQVVIEELFIQQALMLAEGWQDTTMQMVLSPEGDGYAWQLFSLSEDMDTSWTRHAFGTLSTHREPAPLTVDLAALQADCPEEIEVTEFYRAGEGGGIEYGPHFQALAKLYRGAEQALGLACLANDLIVDAAAYHLHPVLLDACLQITAAMLTSESEAVYLPSGLERLTCFRSGVYTEFWAHARAISQVGDTVVIDVDLFDANGQGIAALKGMSFRRAGQHALMRNPAMDWLYDIAWQPMPADSLASSGIERTGRWLILADETGLGKTLAARLEAQGHSCVLAAATQADQAGFADLLRGSTGAGQPFYQGVVYLWGLDPDSTATALSRPEFAHRICDPVLALVQAMIQAEIAPQLWLVTQGAQAIGKTDRLQVQQAPLWGLGRTIAREHPELQCVCLDLAAEATLEDNAHALLEALSGTDAENQIAYRQGTRYVARLVRQRDHDQRDIPLHVHETGSYLITGGLGGLGLRVAQWLVAEGARQLVLCGRRGAAAPEAQRAVEALQQAGAQVVVLPADVAVHSDVARMLAAAQEHSLAPLRGIIHAAGVLDDGILLQQSSERFAAVMAPKVAGSWYLHQLTETMPLDFLVCFSSTASVLGAPGQGNYAAANAFMDALMHHRRALGLPGLSINWGGWSEVGMAAASDLNDPSSGIGAILPEQGVQVLGALLRRKTIQAMVWPVDWSVLRQQFAGRDAFPLLSDWLQQDSANHRLQRDWLSPLQTADPVTRQQLLIAYLQDGLTQLLGAGASGETAAEMSLTALGLDSLMTIELANRIKAELAISVPVRKFLEGLSVAQLAQYINTLITVQALHVTPADEDEEHETGRL